MKLSVKLLLIAMIGPAFCFSQDSVKTLIIRPDSITGKDATIDNNWPTVNYGSDENFICNAWTSGGIFFIQRAFIEFDLSQVSTQDSIATAYLSLYCNTTSGHAQLHSMYPGSFYDTNTSYLKRIVSSWTETGITWNNQPFTTDTNKVMLPASTSNIQNYLNIDITSLVKDARKSNTPNAIGLMLQLQTEAIYRCLVFASSDHADSTIRPKLEITYIQPNKIKSVQDHNSNISVYPTVANDNVNVVIKKFTNNPVYISLIDNQGKQIVHLMNNDVSEEINTQISVAELPNGLYFLHIADNDKYVVRKIIIHR